MLAVRPFSPWSASPARTIWMHLNSLLIHSHNRVLKLRSRNHARRKICICRAADWPQNNETNPILRPATAVVCITAISCWLKHFRTMSATPVYAATSVGRLSLAKNSSPSQPTRSCVGGFKPGKVCAETTRVCNGRCRRDLSKSAAVWRADPQIIHSIQRKRRQIEAVAYGRMQTLGRVGAS